MQKTGSDPVGSEAKVLKEKDAKKKLASAKEQVEAETEVSKKKLSPGQNQ